MTKTSVETKYTWIVSFYLKEEKSEKEEQIERMLSSTQESDQNAMMTIEIGTRWEI